MDGHEVFKFAVRIIEKTSLDVLKEANIPLEEIDYLVLIKPILG